jgi:hypothetical protein
LQELNLDSVLRDVSGMDKLLNFAKLEYSDENLLFWRDARSYRAAPDQSSGAAVIDTYLCASAELMVNLPAEIAKPFKSSSSVGQYAYTAELFDTAVAEIYAMIKRDTFSRFKLSDAAEELLQLNPGLAESYDEEEEDAEMAATRMKRRSSISADANDDGRAGLSAIKDIIKEWKVLVGCERITVWLLDPGSRKLYNVAADQLGNSLISVPLGVGLAGKAAKSGDDAFIRDAYEDPSFNQAVDKALNFRTRAVCCVVLKDDAGFTMAVVQAINKTTPDAVFEPADADTIRLRQADVLALLTGHYHNTRVSQWTPVR